MENSLLNSFHTGSLDPKSSVVTNLRLYQMQEPVGMLPGK